MAMGGFEPLEAVGSYSTGAKVPSWGQRARNGRRCFLFGGFPVMCRRCQGMYPVTAAGVQLPNSQATEAHSPRAAGVKISTHDCASVPKSVV
jgi:hypothetical protein